MQDSQLYSWLALSHMPGMSSQTINKLLAVFKSPQAILDSEPEELKALGLKPQYSALISNFQNAKRASPTKVKIEESLQWREKSKSRYLLCQGDENYPSLLKEIPNSPVLLYVKGDIKLLSLPQLAMVGSRNPAPSGRKNASRFAKDLTGAGCIVCSGMASGIDYESHFGALEQGGQTVGVLGTGIDEVYPFQNRKLAGQICEQGVLISEFPLGSKPERWHFPLRNRIISGLSMGTLVVEAALRSGSLITARFAQEQGREVFAIPGSIHSATSKGCHALIKEGAKLVENLEDILEELSPFIALAKEQVSQTGSQPEIVGVEALVLSKIDYDAVSINSLLIETGLNIAKLNVLLVELELKNLIVAVPGGYALLAP